MHRKRQQHTLTAWTIQVAIVIADCFTSGVAQWLACWAHNPKVRGSKPRSAIFQSLHHFEKCILFKHTSIPIDNNKNTCSQSPIQLPDLRSRSTIGHRICVRVLLFCFNVWSGTCGLPPLSTCVNDAISNINQASLA